ncbi:hypothetical protein [Pararhodospirillum photometricum]|uniref:Uncharacterized protein n=1 Tax=Pararhodospirillum photometricum DSM 122 TaxID=1150469 RepID=H6SRX3_PARPM|nr:hypothetical protein [Pararhodospirillum photometricum]CCG07652.1 unnamed protein product [Pararhodospirillum photometricum DSM 122]
MSAPGLRLVLLAALAPLLGRPLVGEGSRARPPAGQAWARAVLAPTSAEGGRGWGAEAGALSVLLYDPQASDPAAADTVCAAVAQGLGGRWLATEGLVLVTGAPARASARFEEGFCVVPLSIPYHAMFARDS